MIADDAWLARAEAGKPIGTFGHREHLRLTSLVLDREPNVDVAAERVSATIRRLAQTHGRPQRYNRTVSEAWVRIVAHCRASAPAPGSVDRVRDAGSSITPRQTPTGTTRIPVRNARRAEVLESRRAKCAMEAAIDRRSAHGRLLGTEPCSSGTALGGPAPGALSQ